MSGRTIPFLVLFALLIHAAIARADEIRLKDGTKITGTIVGFENDSFRVETSYGYALVQKDKVADINISAAKKDLESKPSTPAATVPSIRPAVSPAVIEEALSRPIETLDHGPTDVLCVDVTDAFVMLVDDAQHVAAGKRHVPGVVKQRQALAGMLHEEIDVILAFDRRRHVVVIGDRHAFIGAPFCEGRHLASVDLDLVLAQAAAC